MITPSFVLFTLLANAAPTKDVTDVSDGAGLARSEERAIAAKALACAPSFVDQTADGLDLLYERKYREFRTYFVKLEQRYPYTAVASIADLLAWQAMMLENFDFRYDAPYQAASSTARAKLDEALKRPGNDAWEHLMYVAVAGIEAIHAARRSKYLPAISLAFEAIGHIGNVTQLAPDLVDIRLADGLYNYWRSALSDKLKGLPNFGDQRELGFLQMTEVAEKGAFLGPPARLSLVFAYLEENKTSEALAQLDTIARSYPDNLINEMMRGITLYGANRLADAEAAFEHVRKIDPKNRRVHYYLGALAQDQRHFDVAKAELTQYLGFDSLEPYQISNSNYRLGRIAEVEKAWAQALAYHQLAYAADGHKAAKRRIDAIKKMARKGEISL